MADAPPCLAINWYFIVSPLLDSAMSDVAALRLAAADVATVKRLEPLPQASGAFAIGHKLDCNNHKYFYLIIAPAIL
jgi:hypothetical protein